MSTRLLYIADPMCSWCFAFAPGLASVRRDLKPEVEFQLVLGGLAPDDDEPMSEEVKEFIQRAWQSIERRTPARFEWSYWEDCHPRRSTWPACRAVLAAGDRGEAMFAAIQKAYYTQACDPSDIDVLVELGVAHGFDASEFRAAIAGEEMRRRLQLDLDLRDALGANSYPSLAIEEDGQGRLLSRGWVNEPSLRELFSEAKLLRLGTAE